MLNDIRAIITIWLIDLAGALAPIDVSDDFHHYCKNAIEALAGQ